MNLKSCIRAPDSKRKKHIHVHWEPPHAQTSPMQKFEGRKNTDEHGRNEQSQGDHHHLRRINKKAFPSKKRYNQKNQAKTIL